MTLISTFSRLEVNGYYRTVTERTYGLVYIKNFGRYYYSWNRAIRDIYTMAALELETRIFLLKVSLEEFIINLM